MKIVGTGVMRSNYPDYPDHPGDDNSILVVETHERGEALMVEVRGEVDYVTAPRFEEALKTACSQLSDLTKTRGQEQAEENKKGKLMVDLQQLDFIDSAGLATLVTMQTKNSDECHMILLIKPKTQPARVIRISGFDRVITIIDSPDAVDLLVLTGI